MLGAVAIGLALGLATDVGDQAERLVVPALVALFALAAPAWSRTSSSASSSTTCEQRPG